MNNKKWWDEKSNFFGSFYVEGDNSKEGHLAKEQFTLSQRTNKEVAGLTRLLKLKKNFSILDVPCGYGRHTIELAKRNFKVTGSDLNSFHLRIAKKEAAKQNLKIKFYKEDMRKLNHKVKFDALINMFYSFGFFATDKENLLVLEKFYEALKPGGKFLMHTDVNIPRILSGKYKKNETRNLPNAKQLQIIDRYNPKTKRVKGIWIITSKDKHKTKKTYSVRVYQKEEFIKMCLRAGFKKCRAYSNWNGTPYSKNSEEIIFVATK